MRLLDAVSFVVLGIAAMSAISLFIPFAVAGIRARAVPTWFGLAAVVIGVLILGAVAAGFGPFAIPLVHLWCVLVAVACRSRG